MDYTNIINLNRGRWLDCEIDPHKHSQAHTVAVRLTASAAKAEYLKIAAATNVPWWVIAVIHEREAGQSWARSLAQGDWWSSVSIHVPKGRGPFKSFYDAAIDSLTLCPPYASRWTDWSAGGALTLLELYNGLGYELYHHEASPYIWAATNHQEWGKYTADGFWSAHVWDSQLGCAALLKAMMEIDPSIALT